VEQACSQTTSIDPKIHEEAAIKTGTLTSWLRNKNHTREGEEVKEEETVSPERTASKVEMVTSPSPPRVVSPLIAAPACVLGPLPLCEHANTISTAIAYCHRTTSKMRGSSPKVISGIINEMRIRKHNT
jgi:hypothetical protein